MDDLFLPKPYLSYSAKTLWRQNKEQFRDRYYRNIVSPQSPEMMFGHAIAKQLETEITDPVLKEFVDSGKLLTFPEREYRIQLTVAGVPLLGVLDMYDMDTHAFRDQKTSHRNPRGEHSWNQARVDSLQQLAFYSMLIEKNHGHVEDKCYLDYMETRFGTSVSVFDGIELEGKSDTLFLTGYIETFERIITPMDRYRELEDVIQAAHEISADYKKYI